MQSDQGGHDDPADTLLDHSGAEHRRDGADAGLTLAAQVGVNHAHTHPPLAGLSALPVD